MLIIAILLTHTFQMPNYVSHLQLGLHWGGKGLVWTDLEKLKPRSCLWEKTELCTVHYYRPWLGGC